MMNSDNEYVGEVAYHYDRQGDIYICNVIILSEYRNQGYGTDGLQQLCKAAKNNGIFVLYDDIAADNPSYKINQENSMSGRFAMNLPFFECSLKKC